MSRLRGITTVSEFGFKEISAGDFPVVTVAAKASGDIEFGTVVSLNENGTVSMVEAPEEDEPLSVYGVCLEPDGIASGESGMFAVTGEFMRNKMIVGDEVELVAGDGAELAKLPFEPRPCLFFR